MIVTMDYGSAIVAPTVTREGHTFAGWQPVLLETVPANDVTYMAQWTVNQYVVTFDASGGLLGIASDTGIIAHGMSVGTLPTPTRVGYTFCGWWTAPNGGVQVSDKTTVTGNVTYYARWIEGEEFTSSATYCVIDLSPGAKAVSYPITYMAALPDGGFNTDEYKTTKLVNQAGHVHDGRTISGDAHEAVLLRPFRGDAEAVRTGDGFKPVVRQGR